MAGEAVQQDHRRIGRLAGLRLEEIAAQGDAVARHLDLLGVGQVGQVLPAMRDLDRHAVGIAEARPSSSPARSSRARLGGCRISAPGVAAARHRPRRPGRGFRPTPRATARPARRTRRPWPGASRNDRSRATTSPGRGSPRRDGSPASAATGDGRRSSARGRSPRRRRRRRRRAASSAQRQAERAQLVAPQVLFAGEEELVELRRLDRACSTAWRAPGRDDGSGAGRDAPGSLATLRRRRLAVGPRQDASRAARLVVGLALAEGDQPRSLLRSGPPHRARRIGEVGRRVAVALQHRRAPRSSASM